MKKTKRIRQTSAPCRKYYGFSYRRRRSKADWAGVNPGDAFKNNLDFYVRLPAQTLAYKMFRVAQMAAARLAGGTGDDDMAPRVKPQLGPCYTQYPSALSIFAAVGLSAYLEFSERAPACSLLSHMEAYLEDPVEHDGVGVDPALYKDLVRRVARTINVRLLLEDLRRHSALASVELYRLFSASQYDLRFRTVQEVVDAVVLYGDILPDWKEMALHHVTRELFQRIESISRKYLDLLPRQAPAELIEPGAHWVREICRALAPYLPRAGAGSKDGESTAAPARAPREGEPFRFAPQSPGSTIGGDIPPLNSPAPPLFTTAQGTAAQTLQILAGMHAAAQGGAEKPDDAVASFFAEFMKTVDAASGQDSAWEDIRSDLVAEQMGAAPFEKSPVEGSPTEGQQVSVRMGDETSTGEIFDRPVTPSDDQSACERLMADAAPIAGMLRRALYPNVEQRVETRRLCSSGALDAGRLALGSFSDTVFKRHPVREAVDRRGRPVLLILCDGSGSLGKNQMRMTKTLAAAWLSATVKSGVQVLAAIYNDTNVRKNVSGPLVRWMYHPHKTPATVRSEAARAIAGIKESGDGGQSDALSITFTLEEARRLARGKMVYLVLISDCGWCRSFNTGLSAVEEVQASLEEAGERMSGKLHTTLVALGRNGDTGLEDIVNKTIPVPDSRMEDYAAVAADIGRYVAECMKEQRHKLRETGTNGGAL